MLSERAVLQEGEEKTFHVKMLEIWYFYHVLVIKNLSEKKCVDSLLPSFWQYIICWEVALTFACIYFKQSHFWMSIFNNSVHWIVLGPQSKQSNVCWNKAFALYGQKGTTSNDPPPTITTICGILGQHGEADDKF